MICKNCGKEITYNQKYCGNCACMIVIDTAADYTKVDKAKRRKRAKISVFFSIISLILVVSVLFNVLLISKKNTVESF